MLLHIRRGGTFNDLVNDAWITAGRLEEFLASARHTLGAVGQLMQLLGMKPPTCLGRLDPPERDDAVPQTMSDSGFDDMEKTGSLVIRMDSTGVVIWNGREVTLTRIQFRLLELLARHAGEGIPYERIERYVWPDACVERQQVSFHRKNLETRLAVTGQSPRIETLASWGLRLALDRSLVRFEESKTTAPVFRHAPASIINVNSVAREVCL